MGLTSLPAVLMQRYDDFDVAIQKARQTSDPEPVAGIYKQALEKVAAQERVALYLLRFSIACFALALMMFTVIGVHQLIY